MPRFAGARVEIDRALRPHCDDHRGDAGPFHFAGQQTEQLDGLEHAQIAAEKPPRFNFIADKAVDAPEKVRPAQNDAHIADDDVNLLIILLGQAEQRVGQALVHVDFEDQAVAAADDFCAVLRNELLER